MGRRFEDQSRDEIQKEYNLYTAYKQRDDLRSKYQSDESMSS